MLTPRRTIYQGGLVCAVLSMLLPRWWRATRPGRPRRGDLARLARPGLPQPAAVAVFSPGRTSRAILQAAPRVAGACLGAAGQVVMLALVVSGYFGELMVAYWQAVVALVAATLALGSLRSQGRPLSWRAVTALRTPASPPRV